VMDIGAIEQRSDSGNQHDIVGPNQFPQFAFSSRSVFERSGYPFASRKRVKIVGLA
jgi:hypothetical protein